MSYLPVEDRDITISADTIITPVLSNSSNFYTSSAQIDNTDYYVSVYDENFASSTPTKEPLFSIALGVSGSNATNTEKATFLHYDALLDFFDITYSEGDPLSSFRAINFNRFYYKEKIHLDSFRLVIQNNNVQNETLVVDKETLKFTRGGRRHPVKIQNSSTIRGYLYPDVGIFIDIHSNAGTGEDYVDRLQNITLSSEETITSNYVFLRVRNDELNHTTNPSILEDGQIFDNYLIDSPRTFITTVGLYNNNNELIAVGKLSRPLTKDFTKEALIRVKLDY